MNRLRRTTRDSQQCKFSLLRNITSLIFLSLTQVLFPLSLPCIFFRSSCLPFSFRGVISAKWNCPSIPLKLIKVRKCRCFPWHNTNTDPWQEKTVQISVSFLNGALSISTRRIVWTKVSKLQPYVFPQDVNRDTRNERADTVLTL